MNIKPDPEALASVDRLIPIAEAAEIVGVSAERIRQLIRKGAICRAERGKVRLVDAVQGYLQEMQHASRQSTSSGAVAVLEARANAIRSRIDREMSKLMPTAESEATMMEMLTMLRDVFAGLPDAFRKHPEVAAALERERDRIFAEAEARIRERHDEFRAGAKRRSRR